MKVRRAGACIGVTLRATHGEGFARPVARGPKPLQLTNNGPARFDFLLPDTLQEFFAPHLGPRRFLIGRHFAFRDHLSRDARVVRAGLPERVEATHPVPAHKDVLQRIVERMAHVQRPGHIRRRDHHTKGLIARRVGACLKGACRFPRLVDAVFCLGCVERFFHRHGSCPGAAGRVLRGPS